MKKMFLAGAAALIAAVASGSVAQDKPLWLRNTALSPDGSTIAFTFKGDIYTVPFGGGSATRLTASPAYDSWPVWSPDGSTIAFGSDREGSVDIYTVAATGGTPVRITTHSGSETPRAYLDDNHILFSSNIMTDAQAAMGPFQAQTYVVEAKPGARPELFMSYPAMSISVDGDRLLYQDRKSYEDVLRKHERSSGTSDIWLLTLGADGKAKNGKFSQLTTFNGQDQCPVWNRSAGGGFYYVSEEDGTLNVYYATLDGREKRQLTKFTTHPVRSLSASADGKKLAFSQGGELYTLIPGQQPQKVNVEITGDLYARDVVKSLERRGATNISVSPDGDEIAFVLRGNVYVTSVKYPSTKQITSTPEQERVVSFGADGRTLVYDSERDGLWQLYTARIKNPDEKKFVYASEIEETPLYSGESPAFQPAFSPDGKKVAFIEGRTEIKVIDVDSKAVNTALDGKYNYSYTDGDVSFSWSPDSRWLLTSYFDNGGWNNVDIALVAADGSKVENLTKSGYSDGNARWALDGKAMIYSSDKQGYRSHGSWGAESDVYIMFFDGEAYDRFCMSEEEAAIAEKADKEKKEKEEKAVEEKKNSKKKGKDADEKKKDEVRPLTFDLANAPYRKMRLTPNASNLGDFYLDKKGEKLYYISAFEGGGDLWVRDLKKGDTRLLKKGVGFGGIEPSKDGEWIAYISSGISKIALPSGEVTNVEFEAPLAHNAAAERRYIFDHMWRQVKEKFYDENLHGVDWELYRTEYEKFLPHINNNYDYAEMLSEILGELNASHTGGRYSAPGASMRTASLGAFYDESYKGDGLKVAEVLPGGPLSTTASAVKAGEIIKAVDGEPIVAGKEYFTLLEGKAGKKVRLTVESADGARRDVTVKPSSSDQALLYRRWVERNRQIVDSLSGGRIGYVHVQGMNSPSFRTVYEEMFGRHRNCDAIVVDTRFNGGGWLHNDLAVLLAGRQYVKFTPRGRYIGGEPFSQWYKPSVMLVNEGNYSDGHGAPYAYQTLGLGEVVGAPIPGTMTAVWWENQVDPSIVFGIPQVTNADVNGNALENKQLDPDVLIYNSPADVLNGHDAQLAGAVARLLEKIGK